MRRLLLLAPLAVFLAMLAYFAVGLGRDPELLPSAFLDKPAPPLALPALAGTGEVTLPPAGKPMLVNFFASWCAPCRVEHPQLMALKAEGVEILGVAYKDKPAASQAFLAALGDPFARAARDESGRTAIDWGVYGVPETFVVDRAGRVQYRHAGPLLPEDMARLRALLR